MVEHRCLECAAIVTRAGVRCRSCGARRRWALSREPKRPFVELEGVRYYRQGEGYYQASRHRGGKLHHRAVWESANGPIPDGWHIHHINGDPGDNRLANLEALHPHEHAARHPDTPANMRRAYQPYARQKRLDWWSRRMPQPHVCEQCGKDFLTTATRVRFCSPTCNSHYWNWRRRKGAKAEGVSP